jgi:hypothetical protein
MIDSSSFRIDFVSVHRGTGVPPVCLLYNHKQDAQDNL